MSKLGKAAESKLKVVVRVRPLLSHETKRGMETEETVVKVATKSFEFGDVVDGPAQFNEVYSKTAGPLIDRLFEGYNATVLAYGQTGSGKTFSMFSPEGVVPMGVKAVFDKKNDSVKIWCSLMEVYNEECRDLLGERHLQVREVQQSKEVLIQGLSEQEVSTEQEVLALLKRGTTQRATAATEMNARSSRSHMIATLKIEKRTESSKTTAKLHFVDLAGSERAKRTGATGDRLREGIGINKSLLALGNVVARLADLSTNEVSAEEEHVPYRDSTLTRVLADSLGGSALAVMIACVSPALDDADESVNTLRWASRATKITNVAKKHEDFSDDSKDLRRRLAREVALRTASEARCHALAALNSQLSRRVDVLRLALGDANLATAAESSIFRDGETDLSVVAVVAEEEIPEAPVVGIVVEEEEDELVAAEEDEAIADDEAKIEALKIEERCMENLRVHYEEAISKLEKEVEELEKERQHHVKALQDATGGPPKVEREKRVFREKARELEKRLTKLRSDAAKAVGDAKRCAKRQEIAEAEARALRHQVDEARRRRGELQKAIQQKDATLASKANEWRREAQKLKRDRDRLSGEKRRMAEEYARAERTRQRQLAESRAQLKRLRGGRNVQPKKKPKSQLPEWLDDEIERRVLIDDDDARRTLEDLAYEADVWELLNSVCDDLARTRAAVRASQANDAALGDETRQWLQHQRTAYQKRKQTILGGGPPPENHLENLKAAEDDNNKKDSSSDDENNKKDSLVAEYEDAVSPTSPRRSSAVLDEYSARCERMRTTKSELDAVAEKLRAVKGVVSEVRAAAALRDTVKREYERPWVQNANLDAINATSDPEPSKPKSYDRPWRVNANLPPPPPGGDTLVTNTTCQFDRPPLADIGASDLTDDISSLALV